MPPPSPTWLPAALLALLGLFLLQKGLRADARRRLGWGRSGAVPLSRLGYVAWGLCLLAAAALLASFPEPPLWLAALLGACFLFMVGVGVRDNVGRGGDAPSPPEAGDDAEQ